MTWSVDDRVKVIAHLMEAAARCPSCGTAQWEWEENRSAYIPTVHVCIGCALREQSAKTASDVAGGSVQLVSGAAKEAELARQREAYMAARDVQRKD